MPIPSFLNPEQRTYFLTHSPIDFVFKQSARDFTVEEVPLYEWSGEGEHLVLKIRKKNLSTQEMLKHLSAETGIPLREIGSAGLKDKHSLSIQHISLPKKYEPSLSKLAHSEIKILEMHVHQNKIRMGHLLGNRFFIRLKKVNPVDFQKLERAYERIQTDGLPNFFGYQRFGIKGDNYQLGQELAHKKKQMRDRKKKDFLISAYQSYLFNRWLNIRIQLSHVLSESSAELASTLGWDASLLNTVLSENSFFKLLPGDKMHHYPRGKLFDAEDVGAESERFSKREVVPTGLLSGTKVSVAEADTLAGELETVALDEKLNAQGSRRFAWIFPEEMEIRYVEEEAWAELKFFLPKGSYATVLLEELAKRPMKEENHVAGD